MDIPFTTWLKRVVIAAIIVAMINLIVACAYSALAAGGGASHTSGDVAPKLPDPQAMHPVDALDLIAHDAGG